MDVDVITAAVTTMNEETKAKYLKQGLCFRCGKAGHISRDCPARRQAVPSSSFRQSPPQYSLPVAPPVTKRMNPKELAAHIRTLTAQYTEGEKEEFLDEAEKEGF